MLLVKLSQNELRKFSWQPLFSVTYLLERLALFCFALPEVCFISYKYFCVGMMIF
jgi:hypothetical protein